MEQYKVFLCEDVNGKDLIGDVIRKLNEVQKAKIARQIRYLKNYGISRSNPVLKKLSGTQI